MKRPAGSFGAVNGGIIPQPPKATEILRASPPLAIDMWRELLLDLARTSNELGDFTVDDDGNILMFTELSPDEAGVLGVPDITRVWIGLGFPDKLPS